VKSINRFKIILLKGLDLVRLLCFSDIHGNADAVRSMVKDVQRKRVVYDAAIFAGDFTNLIFDHDITLPQKSYDETVELVSGICDHFYYIFGNRDRPQDYFRLNAKGTLIDRENKYRISEDLWITTTPRLIDGNTIYVEHNPFMPNSYGNKAIARNDSYLVYKKARLHIAGHTHKGLFTRNYLNTGFLYEDGAHGAEPIMGGYCDVNITGQDISVQYNSIGPLREAPLDICGYRGKQFTLNEPYCLNIVFN
jgi:predicted phosphodiesterase